jgi:hypothetical protein
MNETVKNILRIGSRTAQSYSSLVPQNGWSRNISKKSGYAATKRAGIGHLSIAICVGHSVQDFVK